MTRWFITALLPFVLGCGLSTYEAKMAESQSRAETFDRTENFLGPAIVQPEGCPVDVFLRAPRGINPNCSPELAYGFFYRYPRAGSGGSTGIFEVCVGVKADGNAEFVRKGLISGFPAAVALPAKTLEVPGRGTYTFETWTETDVTAKSYLFLHRNGNNVVAVTFRVDKDKANADSEKAIDSALRTLAVGPAATALRSSYRGRGASAAR